MRDNQEWLQAGSGLSGVGLTFREEAFFGEDGDGVCEEEADVEGRPEEVDHGGSGRRVGGGGGSNGTNGWIRISRYVASHSRHRLSRAHQLEDIRSASGCDGEGDGDIHVATVSTRHVLPVHA